VRIRIAAVPFLHARSPLVPLAAAAVALVLAAAPAEAKRSVKIVGWTTQPGANAPQVKDGGTIRQCLDTGGGQRSLYVIYRGKGIAKKTRVGAAVWGGPAQAGFSAEPANADVDKAGFKWPVGSRKSYTTRYGFSFAKGPFGPQNINGAWNAKVLVKGKVARRGSVTVAC
jgi:hypothetical protein